jgi:hypothetical protein
VIHGLKLFELNFFRWEVFDELEVFFSGADSFVADELANEHRTGPSGEVVGDESVAQVVDLSTLDSSNLEIAVDGGSDIPD